jgi:hypothetical protein
LRRTDRRPFADEPVPEQALDRLRDAAREAGAHLHIARAQDLTAIAVAAGHAAAEQADPAYRTELAAWTRAHRTLAAAGVDLADLTEMHPAA